MVAFVLWIVGCIVMDPTGEVVVVDATANFVVVD